ncbi:MAG: trypsin-like serine protease, partial [Gammaproteobacteria bacterium]|nr:trypsin-like serine protease [Gammaproteobacteria bacterium]
MTKKKYQLIRWIAAIGVLAIVHPSYAEIVATSDAERATKAREAWTATAFAEAEPRPIPIVDMTVRQMIERGLQVVQPTASSLLKEPRPQDGYLTLAERLVDAEDLPVINEAAAVAAGTHEQYYSSSRLIPTSARLTYPYRAAGKIFFEDDGSNFICSGSVIDRRLVVTAGHCVHSGSDGDDGFFENVVFIPAWHEGDAPFKLWAATWIATTPSWASSNGVVPNDADFAIFEVADQDVDGEMRALGDVVGTY